MLGGLLFVVCVILQPDSVVHLGVCVDRTVCRVWRTSDAICCGEEELNVRRVDLFASADIQTRLHSDMLHYLWVQYAITGGLWAALIQAGSLDAMLNDREATSAALRAVCECLRRVVPDIANSGFQH